jgi:hypothetical protein
MGEHYRKQVEFMHSRMACIHQHGANIQLMLLRSLPCTQGPTGTLPSILVARLAALPKLPGPASPHGA